jgi:hypothetical protein
MRLLQRSDTGEFSLHSFGDKDTIPPYAILSHTWGADEEEVTFEDLTNGTGKKKTGKMKTDKKKTCNEKLRFCEDQARQDGLQYFWIDTCCINKENLAELSHAINSMFRWYRNATRCYVYLSDVSTRKRKRDRGPGDTWESDFRKSRWFTRGWTLQELLAPASVEFFSRERKRLGNKSSLRQQIQEITNISHSALQGNPLSRFSKEERLRWIEHRQTKLKEDRAYSLLGIFGVYILPIYGEGESKAFDRLLDEFHKMQKCLQKCLQDLRLTDPRDDKKRIEDMKGGLLEDAYRWILQNSDFQQWRDNQKSCLLWIKGDPGKGKTMLLCGIIDDLARSKININLTYFFCQATDSRINNAMAVLRGLVYLLVDQQPSLISHLKRKHDYAGKTLFEDANAWVALSEILTTILQDPSLNSTYIVIDALDECETGLTKLLDLIVMIASTTPHVKWIVSSRNESYIEQKLELDNGQTKLSLELHADHVSHAVEVYIDHKVSHLLSVKNDRTLQESVRNQMRSKADGTFLWVALVFQELQRIQARHVLKVLKDIPAGLSLLYQRMMKQIVELKYDRDFCYLVLATVTIAYRPLHLLELGTISGLPEEEFKTKKDLEELINTCGSFLVIRGDYIYFIHQSAKDYLDSEDLSKVIFPTGRGAFQYDISSRSIQAMSQRLKQDIYELRLPGASINSVQVPNPNPLAPLGYSCVYWASHFDKAYQNDLTDGGKIHQFLQTNLLYWLEALSLLGEISIGVLTISSLESYILVRRCIQI